MSTAYGAHRLPRQISDKKDEIRENMMTPADAIADVTGGDTQDAEARAAIDAILAALRTNNIILTA
jgi:hypothetical protein